MRRDRIGPAAAASRRRPDRARGDAVPDAVCSDSGRTVKGNQVKLIIGIAALLVAVLLFLKLRSRTPVRREDTVDLAATARLKHDFHAVSIRPGAFACKTARDLEGRRFLSGTAPRIPLPECDATDCTCRFSHHADRRGGEDRRSLYRSSIGIDIESLGVEKRSDHERRSEDRD